MTETHKTITQDYHPSKTGISDLGATLTSPRVVDPEKHMESGCSLVWSRTSACHADDPGSNLGNRTKTFSKITKNVRFPVIS